MNAQTKTTTLRTVDVAYIGMFVAVMAICSWISIPATVPFTLQTFAVFMAVGLLGGKRGTIAVVTYVLLGAVGAPVFAGFAGGIGALLGNSVGNYRWIHYRIYFFCIDYVGHYSAFWREDLGVRTFYGAGTDCMLCIWNLLVYDCLHGQYRGCGYHGCVGMVCFSVYRAGSV